VFARIAAHFALEETVMRKYRYDEYAEHKAEHEQLLDEIRNIMDRNEDSCFGNASEALATTVRDWFVNHFKTRDARLHGKLGI
jgi:hemerythrin